MPIGSYVVLPHVAHALATSRPQRVLDLGAGFGLYGAVVREWLDGGVKPWRTLLVGVEGHAPYGNPLWDLYNVMAIDTIERFLDRHADLYDAVLLLDVIEHFEKAEGWRRLDQAQQRQLRRAGSCSSRRRRFSSRKDPCTATRWSSIAPYGPRRSSPSTDSVCSATGSSTRSAAK